MKQKLQSRPCQTAVAALLSFALVGQTVLAGDNLRTANRNAGKNFNRNANVNVNKNANVNVNRNANVNVNRHVHVDVDHHYGHGGFWAGVGTAMVVGAVIASIPPTRTVVVVSGTSYYYAEGVYYVQGTSGYTVVGAPVGATVAVVPAGALTVLAGPTTYYYFNGTYYVQQGTAFVVVSPPLGVTVTALPVGASQVVVNGVVHYAHGGIFYRPAFQNGVTVYTTVKL